MTTTIEQLSNRKLCDQIRSGVEDGLEPEEAGEKKVSQEVHAIVQAKADLRAEPRQGQWEREQI